MILILIFAEALALYGLIGALVHVYQASPVLAAMQIARFPGLRGCDAG